MDHTLLVMAALVLAALAFDFLNGFHDAANSVALMVSTRLLTPQAAVAWAAFFNFIAFLFFGLAVAKTIGAGIISPAVVDNAVIFGALCGAIAWNMITWWFGIPSSSSHALVGGLVGAAAYARALDIPHLQVANVADVRAEELYEQADFGPLARNHAARLARMTRFLERNRLGHIHQPGESGAAFDARMSAASLPPAVRPATTLGAFIGALQRRLPR